MTATRFVGGVVVTGHGVASGASDDPRFPSGTLGLQFPIFSRLGVDLDGIHQGTINVELDRFPIDPGEPEHLLTSVKWHHEMPPEDFSLWRVKLIHAGDVADADLPTTPGNETGASSTRSRRRDPGPTHPRPRLRRPDHDRARPTAFPRCHHRAP